MYLKHTTNWRKFSSVTAESWLNKYCGKNAYSVIWDPLLRGKFHEERHIISMSWMWGRINTRANSTKGKNSEEMLGYLKGSLDVLYKSLTEKLKLRKTVFHLSTTVTAITLCDTDNKACVLTTDDKYTFDKVICTVPSNVFAKLVESSDVPDDYIEKLLSIRYLSAACILFTSPQPLSSYYWHNINDNASPFVVFLQHTNLVDDEIYDHKNVYYMGGYFPNDHRFLTLPENEVLDEWFKHLSTIFPNFDMNLIENKYLFRFKNAQQVIDCGYENRIPNHKTPLKNVFLYNFSQIYPEGRGVDRAIREAYDATQMLLNETQ